MPVHYTSDNLLNDLSVTDATAGSVLFVGTDGVVQQDNASLFWDDTNNRLGIGITPTRKLHILNDTAATPAMTVKAASGQSTHVAEWTRNDGEIYGRITQNFQVAAGTNAPWRSDPGIYAYSGQDAILGIQSGASVKAKLQTDTAGNIYFGSESGHAVKVIVSNATVVTFATNGRTGFNQTVPTAFVHIDQSSTTGAIPVLTVDQADVSEEFIRFIGTSANGVLTQSIVEEADIATATRAGFLKIYVQDDGNQLTDQAYFVPIYTLA